MTYADISAALCAAADGFPKDELWKYQSKVQVISCVFDECSKCEYVMRLSVVNASICAVNASHDCSNCEYVCSKCEYVIKLSVVNASMCVVNSSHERSKCEYIMKPRPLTVV